MWVPAPFPENEATRLDALLDCKILDTDYEQEFDRIVELAAAFVGVPISLISLIDTTRQWFKAKVGVDVRETPRDAAFCSYAILNESPLEVPDTHLDGKFLENPLVVGAPFIRFYFGVPLVVTEGLRVGTLCVIDTKPRELTDAQRDVLRKLAAVVTDELRLRTALRRNELINLELEKATKAKSEFLSRMSHELRTPLNAILGFAQLLEYNPKERLSKSQADCVSRIMMGGQHLLNLINDILDLAKIEAGKLDISLESVDPVLVIQESLQLVEGMAEARRISIATDLKPLGNVRADFTRLHQCFINFLSNAVKYNREGGHISVSLSDNGDGTARLSVSDTGLGISKERMGELFKPFSRLGAEARQIEGSGIGLALTRELVGMMNGRVGCESEPDKGSRFWMDLPKMESVADAAAKVHVKPLEPLSGLSLRLLYIEDNPANVDLVRMVSEHAGFALETAHTGELGFDMARNIRPDVILLDINLPGIDGYEVLRRLQVTEDTAHIPVIGLSAQAARDDIERAAGAGFFRYLTKPTKIQELLETISSAADETRKHK